MKRQMISRYCSSQQAPEAEGNRPTPEQKDGRSRRASRISADPSAFKDGQWLPSVLP
jgi:hypothetical protein